MGFFDRLGNLGRGVVGMWKRSEPRKSPDSKEALEAELEALRRRAKVDEQLRRAPGPETDAEDPEESSPTEPIDSLDDGPVKKTL